EVVRQECVREDAEREGREDELARGGRPCERHPLGAAEGRACERQRRLDEAEAQHEHERELAELRHHWPLASLPRASASATSGGMYVSSCFASTSSATNTPSARSRPRATTPCPSSKSGGSIRS